MTADDPIATDAAAVGTAAAGAAAVGTGRGASPAGGGAQPGRAVPSDRYPLMLSMAGGAVVVGGGQVALRRAQSLLDSGADVVVIAPSVVAELAALPVAILRRPYRDGDLSAAWLAHAATDDPDVNSRVADEADRQRIWWCAPTTRPRRRPGRRRSPAR